ncbi:MAG: formylglycine-generating enzyme family protein [Gemmatimonadetes bacterium]|nr:formylglycine-generating enzyme family protein [Gemmatimonadota bacterium]
MTAVLKRWPALAAVGLVLAVWLSLSLAPDAPAGQATPEAPAVELPAELAGFRADAWFLPDDGMLGFVEVPGGPFTMGSDRAVDPLAFDIERWSPTQAQGRVDVPTFYIGRYEVTGAQYAVFVRESGHRVADQGALTGRPNFPVVSVAWTDALAYARWLEQALRASSVTPAPLARLLSDGWHVTLPTEAEWEKAARGTDGRIFPLGDAPRAERANYQGPGLTRVGAFECPECPYGLADMSGNAWEWTRSPYQAYPYDESDDAASLDADALWVMRGGSFSDGPQNIRAAVRGGADPGARRPFIGFRLALSR